MYNTKSPYYCIQCDEGFITESLQSRSYYGHRKYWNTYDVTTVSWTSGWIKVDKHGKRINNYWQDGEWIKKDPVCYIYDSCLLKRKTLKSAKFWVDRINKKEFYGVKRLKVHNPRIVFIENGSLTDYLRKVQNNCMNNKVDYNNWDM